MTQDHAMVIPLMVAALIADATSRLVCKDGLYHALSFAFMPAPDRAALREDMPATAAEPT